MGKYVFDQYSLLHFAIGIIAYFWNISLFTTVCIHVLFEIMENSVHGLKFIYQLYIWPGGKPYADSIHNSIGDTIATIAGWLLSQHLDNYGVQYKWYPSFL